MPDLAVHRPAEFRKGIVPAAALQCMEQQAVRFLALRQIAYQRAVEIPSVLIEALDDAVRAPVEVQCALFSLPHIRQWCITLGEFLVTSRDAEGVSDRIELHAMELQRLLLASKIRVYPDQTHCGRVVVHTSGSLHLPGAGLIGRFPDHMRGESIELQVQPGVAPFAHTLRNDIGEHAGAVELWSTDLLVRKAGSRVYEFPTEDDAEIGRWRALIQEYLSEVRRLWPEFYAEVPHLLRGIVSVNTPSGETHLSGTFAEVPGAIYMSWSDSREVIKEAVTHELFHTRLNLVLDEEQLDRSLLEEPVFWSPWRYTVRPVVPFIHGAYAHYGMMLYNDRVARHAPDSNWRSKLATHLMRLSIAEAQWERHRATTGAPVLLAGVMLTIMSDMHATKERVQADLREELLAAAVGERGEWRLYRIQGGLDALHGAVITDTLDRDIARLASM